MYNPKAINWYEKGRLLEQQRNLSGAERAYRKAIKINRDFVEAYNNLGNVLLDLGRVKEAANSFRKALSFNPDNSMLLNNMGISQQELGNLEPSIKWYRKAIESDPGFAGACNNLGNVYYQSGQLDDAINAYNQAIDIAPDYADALTNLGRVLFGRGEVESSLDYYQRAVAADRYHYEAHIGLAAALKKLGRLDESVSIYDRAREIRPKHEEALFGLAGVLRDQGKFDAAIDMYRAATAINPLHEGAYMNLGNLQSDLGDIEGAIISYRRVLEIAPDAVEAFRSLAKNKLFTGVDDDVLAMENRYESKSITDSQKMHLAFGLGKAYEDIGDYEKSIELITQANHLKRGTINFSISEQKKLFERIETTFSAEFLSRHKNAGDPDRSPVFILGMPRSGTSLVEQILASHPDVFGAGELNKISDIIATVLKANPGASIVEAFDSIGSDTIASMANEYLCTIHALAPGKRRVTDKMPHNFLYIGFIKTILPNARIVHCIRDPMDNCLSIFKNFFNSTHYYSYDMVELGQYFNLYRQLMVYWKTLFPQEIYDCSYEQLVDSPEGQIRDLLEHCGLAWHDECLTFHKTRRNVVTASNAQVRRPLYKASIELWKQYESGLNPLYTAIYEQEKTA